MIQEIDMNLVKILENYGKYLKQKQYMTEGLNCERIAINYITKKDVCNPNVNDRPKLVRQLAHIDQKLQSIAQIEDTLIQERIDIIEKLTKTEIGYIDKKDKNENGDEKNAKPNRNRNTAHTCTDI
jgi:hypothetical protein